MTAVRFWFDPGCPFCWLASKWVREVTEERELDVTWEPISLLLKNQPGDDNPWKDRMAWTHGLLRVVESVRAAEGNAAVGELYLELGRRIHHDQQAFFDATEALQTVGLDPVHAGAADDPRWDAEIERKMADAFEIVGTDVGTPIIAVRDDGRWTGLFGPVLSAPVEGKDAVQLWDNVVWLAALPQFYELKRSRSGPPDPGQRP